LWRNRKNSADIARHFSIKFRTTQLAHNLGLKYDTALCDAFSHMHTQTHIIMGAALFGRKIPAYAWAGVIGGVIPDIPMFAFVAALKFNGVPDILIFNLLYFQNWWQISNGISHSLIFWPLIFATSWILKNFANERWRNGVMLVSIVAASATVHSVIDMLCHREDAHMHFWPLTWWKFMSPVSYYNSQFYGRYFSAFEAVLGITMAIYLMKTYQSRIVRGLLGIAAVLYVAVPVYFIYLN
jgi:LexA-binding, inner membrane-associated putative hydrolase